MSALFLSNTTPGEATGTIKDWPSNAIPPGWLLCYGQELNRITYAALFAVIGTTYGAGNGTTTFNLPDLRGRVSAGKDDMGGANAGRLVADLQGGLSNTSTLGSAGGEAGHAITSSESAALYWTPGVQEGINYNPVAGFDGALGFPHNNVQPTMILNKIIKT